MFKKIFPKIKVFAAIIFIPVIHALTFAQQNDIYLFIDSNTIIGKIRGDKIYTSETEIAYSLQGKILYKGSEIQSDFIVLIADVDDFFSKRTGIVYQADGKTVQYITQRNEMYLGDYPVNKYYERLLFMEKKNDSVIQVMHGIDESFIGTIEGVNITTLQIIAAGHLYIKHYNLDEQVEKIANEKLGVDENGISNGGTIKPKYGGNLYNEWIWDGTFLKPAWGMRPEDEWKFDGKYLEPSWNLDPQNEWNWDGSILKPSWEQSVKNQWIWEGNILRPFWDNNPDRTFILEDNLLRPMWSYDPAFQWEIEGSVPLPVIAIIVLGIADR